MRTCPNPKCGREWPAERDWCTCGEYLRWEATGTTPGLVDLPVAAANGTPLMTQAVPPSTVPIALLAEDGEWISSPALEVQPGERASLRLRIRNQRGIVDRFCVVVDGLRDGWWSVTPHTLHLVPFGSNGASEQDAIVTLHPPRIPDATAGDWPVRLLVLAGDERREAARASATVRIGRFDALDVTLTPQRRVPVDEAKRELDAHHLEWQAPELRQSRQPVGTVLETIPPTGAVRLRGARVTLIVATDSRRARVPDLVGKTYKNALVALVNAGFDAGPPPDDLEAEVREQIPEAGTPWPRGRAVQLRFERPQKHKPSKVRLPAVAGASVIDAQAALAAAGLEAKTTRAIDAEPAGTVLSSKPARGALAPGSTVALRVSAGFPQLAYDDGRRIHLADGRDGTSRRRLKLAGGGRQSQPAWTPDGLRLVYRSGGEDAGRIWVASASPVPQGGRALTSDDHDDRRPAVSPDGNVVAFVRGTARASAHRLCFVRLAGSAVSCVRGAGTGLSRPVWAPEGGAASRLPAGGDESVALGEGIADPAFRPLGLEG